MPQVSRYSDQQIETLLAELSQLFDSHQAPTDLQLMVLGNMVTHLLNTAFSPSQRQKVADSFIHALTASICNEKAH